MLSVTIMDKLQQSNKGEAGHCGEDKTVLKPRECVLP